MTTGVHNHNNKHSYDCVLYKNYGVYIKDYDDAILFSIT